MRNIKIMKNINIIWIVLSLMMKENKKNVDEIPSSIKGKLKLIFADNVEEVLKNALIGVDKSDN